MTPPEGVHFYKFYLSSQNSDLYDEATLVSYTYEAMI